MADTLFDCPLFVKSKHFVDEISSLENAFDLLEVWPADQRGPAHAVLMDACHEAANGRLPLSVVRQNLERFLNKTNMLALIENVPYFGIMTPNCIIGRS